MSAVSVRVVWLRPRGFTIFESITNGDLAGRRFGTVVILLSSYVSVESASILDGRGFHGSTRPMVSSIQARVAMTSASDGRDVGVVGMVGVCVTAFVSYNASPERIPKLFDRCT